MTHPAAAELMSPPQQSARLRGAPGWSLASGEARRLVIGPGPRWLQVDSGTLWFTTTAARGMASEDQWLQPGEAVWLVSGTEVVLEGRGAASFALLVPPQACAGVAEQAPWAARLGRLLPRWWTASQWSGPTAAQVGGLAA